MDIHIHTYPNWDIWDAPASTLNGTEWDNQ